MQCLFNIKKQILSGLLLTLLLLVSCSEVEEKRDFYQLKTYSMENEQQEMRMDNFLKDAYLPALHRAGISHVGVFKPVEEDTLAGNLIYVLIPFESINQYEELGATLLSDEQFQADGSDYIDAAFDNAPYQRINSVLMRAFTSFPVYGVPAHTTPVSEQIYELRSYQSSTEKLHEKKVQMFNSGESKIFVDLGFQPVFFGEVISGPIMPNLMYLTTHENTSAQEEHWTAFRIHPDWLELKADKQYDHTTSLNEIFYLHPTDYSDF